MIYYCNNILYKLYNNKIIINNIIITLIDDRVRRQPKRVGEYMMIMRCLLLAAWVFARAGTTNAVLAGHRLTLDGLGSVVALWCYHE